MCETARISPAALGLVYTVLQLGVHWYTKYNSFVSIKISTRLSSGNVEKNIFAMYL